MADISIIEFGVYGFVAYSSLLMLIISTIKEVPSGRASAIVRSVWLLPGILCAAILAGSGINIVTDDITTGNTIKNLNSSEVWTEVTTQTKQIVLQNEIWITVHLMIMLVLVAYVIQQMLTLLMKKE